MGNHKPSTLEKIGPLVSEIVDKVLNAITVLLDDVEKRNYEPHAPSGALAALKRIITAYREIASYRNQPPNTEPCPKCGSLRTEVWLDAGFCFDCESGFPFNPEAPNPEASSADASAAPASLGADEEGR